MEYFKVITMNRNLTTLDLSAATRLKEIIKLSPKKLTQGQIAEKMGFKGQGVVSQYVNGKISLGTDATIKFANLFDVEPTAIRPELEDELQTKKKVVLADYNKVIETVEIQIAKENAELDYKQRIKLYELSYKLYINGKDLVAVGDLTKMMLDK